MYKRLIIVIIVLLGCLTATRVQSSQFYRKGREIYDLWGVCRTRAMGEDGYFQILPTGFRPVIVFENLGSVNSLASRWAEDFLTTYPESEYRAKKIFEFVKNRVNYIHDIKEFGYQEFAQNADELADRIEEGSARGDCEDYAILLATLYKMTGYRSAIALTPGHAAALVYLPGYRRSNVSMRLGSEEGWIWVEATGKNNYFGWIPPTVLTSSVVAYEIKEVEEISLASEPTGELIEVRRKERRIPPFLSFIFIILILPILVRLLRVFLGR